MLSVSGRNPAETEDSAGLGKAKISERLHTRGPKIHENKVCIVTEISESVKKVCFQETHHAWR